MEMKQLVGGKGANPAEMTSVGLPVPPGFTINTKTCADYNDLGGRLSDGLMDKVRQNMAVLQEGSGKPFGSEGDPLLVSVRSGAAVSMPGMMDTVLNLGHTDNAVEGLAKVSGDRRFALDAYRWLINRCLRESRSTHTGTTAARPRLERGAGCHRRSGWAF
jgi:pyruvate,orthophosphate dikinase